MKTKKILGQTAKKLVKISLDPNGRLDIKRIDAVLAYVAKDASLQKTALLKLYKKALLTYHKQHSVLVESALALTNDQEHELKTAIEKKFGKSMTVNISTNPSLIGGLKVIADDMIFDQSVKGKFEAIQKQFMVVGL